jgi:hypothetical protein
MLGQQGRRFHKRVGVSKFIENILVWCGYFGNDDFGLYNTANNVV